MKPFGYLFAILGGILILVGMLISGSSDGEILNIGLLNEKANLVTAGGAAAVCRYADGFNRHCGGTCPGTPGDQAGSA